MPNSICDTKPASGFVSSAQSSEENFVNCALSRDRILLSCTGGDLGDGLDFSQKPFYHGFRPHPLPNPAKLLIFGGLGYRPFRFWGNSCKTKYIKVEGNKIEGQYDFDLEGNALRSTIKGQLGGKGLEGTYATTTTDGAT